MGDRAEERAAMVDHLASQERVTDERVLAAMRAVPRHAFVPEDRRDAAYRDRPLPIGDGQTISAPHMVAIMAERLALEPGQDVLEVGTGCGYHAAVTAELVGAAGVYSVEYRDALAERARETLAGLGYDSITIRAGDGRDGWPAHAPYDRAYLTCAASQFPPAVVEQVRAGGHLLGPIGNGRQVLVRARKGEDGGLDRERFGGVRFVSME